MLAIALVAAFAAVAHALNNGFDTPAMGYSTWNDCSSFRDNGPDGWCWDSEAHVKNVTLYLISSGLAKLGYTQVCAGVIRERALKHRDHSPLTFVPGADQRRRGLA